MQHTDENKSFSSDDKDNDDDDAPAVGVGPGTGPGARRESPDHTQQTHKENQDENAPPEEELTSNSGEYLTVAMMPLPLTIHISNLCHIETQQNILTKVSDDSENADE